MLYHRFHMILYTSLNAHQYMLRVKTKIKESSINGIGLFADQFIPKGTVTWQYDQKFDVGYTEEDLNEMPEMARAQFIVYAYYDHERQLYILCSDFQRFINHSDTPNIDSTPDQDVAARDIEPGEEMTCDYRGYEHDWFERRGLNADHTPAAE
jgi:uncharacterized protein